MASQPRPQASITELRKRAHHAEREGNVRLANGTHQQAKQLLAREFHASSSVERAITDTLYEYERARTPVNGPLFTSGYLRRAFRSGITAAVDRLVVMHRMTGGFEHVRKIGRPELAFESVVLKYPRAFSAAAVQSAQARLHSGPRCWWVNHKQTYRHEVGGGYLWSPKRNKNGAQNRTYENMTRVQPAEVVFSYADGAIRAIGHAASVATSAKQPPEFGRAGKAWSKHDGWKVEVRFTQLAQPFKPAAHMRELAPLLPPTHSPIQSNGKGNQAFYLTEISPALAAALQQRMRKPEPSAPPSQRERVTAREAEELSRVEQIKKSPQLTRTMKRYLIAARIGQGLFRQNLEALEAACRVTGIADPRFLRASHIRPWRRSNNRQRLDGHNGLLLATHIDHLFDSGYISFEDDGQLIVSKTCPPEILSALGVRTPLNVGAFHPAQQVYLRYHRRRVFKGPPKKARRPSSRRPRSSKPR